MAQLIQFTLCRGPTVQTEMSLATARIHCTISQRLSGVMEDCSIVQGQHLRMLCHQWCCMSTSRRMFSSLWNAVAAHEHWRQELSCLCSFSLYRVMLIANVCIKKQVNDVS